MARQRINGSELYSELSGDGEDTIVLIHGSWTDHLSWQLVAPTLAARHRVVTYDRRGHSRSDRPSGPASRRVDEDDLAALVETLELGAVHLIGNSYGGSIALGMAARRPDLVASVAAHEPPLLGAARLHPALVPEMTAAQSILTDVTDLLRAGDLERGARHFVDEVLGRGAWKMLSDASRHTFIANSETFLDSMADPHWDDVPAPVARPVLLTDGDASPPWLRAIVRALMAGTCAHAGHHTFAGAGHVPHLTDPASYAATVESFVAASRARPAESSTR